MEGSTVKETTLKETNMKECEKILYADFDNDDKTIYSFIVTNTTTYNTATVLGTGGIPILTGFNLKAKIVITNKNFYLLQYDALNKYMSHHKISLNKLILKEDGKYFKISAADKIIYEGMIHEENLKEILDYLKLNGASIIERKSKSVITWIRNNPGLAFITFLMSLVILNPIFLAISTMIKKLIELLF